MSYNGWKNYETWAVGMFLDGNYTGEGTYREVLEVTTNAVAGSHGQDESYSPVYAVADALEQYVRDEVETGEASLASDLLGAALSEVNWRELADHKVEEVTENEAQRA